MADYHLLWNQHTIQNFDVDKDRFVAAQGESFAQTTMTEAGGDTKVGSISQGDVVYSWYLVRGVKISQFTEKNFEGFSGSFSDIVKNHPIPD